MKRLLILLFILFSVTQTYAQTSTMPKGNFWDKRGYFLVRFGFVSSGTFTVDGGEEDTQTGFSFGAAMEFRIAPTWHAGFGVDVHRFHLADSGQYFIDVTATLKRNFFSPTSKIGLRPGIALGCGSMDYFVRLNHPRIDRTFFMTWKTTFETIFYSRTHVAPFMEFGLIGSLIGGNHSHDLHFGPSTYARVGMMF